MAGPATLRGSAPELKPRRALATVDPPAALIVTGEAGPALLGQAAELGVTMLHKPVQGAVLRRLLLGD